MITQIWILARGILWIIILHKKQHQHASHKTTFG